MKWSSIWRSLWETSKLSFRRSLLLSDFITWMTTSGGRRATQRSICKMRGSFSLLSPSTTLTMRKTRSRTFKDLGGRHKTSRAPDFHQLNSKESLVQTATQSMKQTLKGKMPSIWGKPPRYLEIAARRRERDRRTFLSGLLTVRV